MIKIIRATFGYLLIIFSVVYLTLFFPKKLLALG
jgi:hypothetical protein